MTTTVVLSGGGSLGAVQVGMMLALAEHGVAPDLLVGTSVGAINGAYLAGRPGREGVEALAGIWSSVRRSDIFPVQPALGLLVLAGQADHFVPHDKLRRLLERHLNCTNLEDASCRLRVVASEVRTGKQVVLSHGPVIDAVLASVAVPGVFPPVRIGRRDLMEGRWRATRRSRLPRRRERIPCTCCMPVTRARCRPHRVQPWEWRCTHSR